MRAKRRWFGVAFIFFICAYRGKPHIRAIPPVITSIGSNVMIECRSDYRLFGCWFFKNHGWLLGYVNSTSTFVIPYVIPSVTAEDAGNYSCECYNEYNYYTETSLPFPLILTGYLQKPDIRIIPLGVTYLQSNVTIECKSRVYTLSGCWFCKDSSDPCYLSKSSTTFGIQYIISQPTILNEGLYFCICDTKENQRTEGSSHVSLILTASLGKPHIRAIPPVITSIGSNVTIECSSDYRLFGCWFYKNHGWLLGYVNSSSTSVIPYFIQSVTAEDAGNYSCKCYAEYNNYTETSLLFPLILTEIDYTAINIIRLRLSFCVFILLVIILVESRCNRKENRAAEHHLHEEIFLS